MAVLIGRQGYAGLAIESVAGTPESAPSVFLPMTEFGLLSKNEKIVDLSSRASRFKDHDAISGKKWSEGDLGMYLDVINSGYLFKLALGNEVKTAVQANPAVHNHQFFPTASGNTAVTSTIWGYGNEGNQVARYSRVAVDSLEIEIPNEGLATMKASLMGEDGTFVSAPTLTTTSGTLFTWAVTNVRFGATLTEALAATPTKVTNIKVNINNNLQMIYRSGSATVSEIALGENEILGDYTVLMEGITEMTAYKNATKQAVVITLTGGSMGGVSEQLQILIPRVIAEDVEIETGQADIFAITTSFRALRGSAEGPFVVNLQNGKTTTY